MRPHSDRIAMAMAKNGDQRSVAKHSLEEKISSSSSVVSRIEDVAAAEIKLNKRPVFSGSRLTVFSWMLDELRGILGSDADRFDLHAWFTKLDQQAADEGLVLTKHSRWDYLRMQLVDEMQRRGLKAKLAPTPRPDAIDWDAIAREGIKR